MSERFDLPAYLDRIGLDSAIPPTPEGLEAVHRAQVYTIPFENLSILLGDRISLQPEELFEKLVRRRRGGYCFELNSLFFHALKALGFDGVRPVLARVHLGGELTGRTHLLSLVTVGDRQWIVDVGFGSTGLRAPIPFQTGTSFMQDGQVFRLVEAPPYGFMLQSVTAGSWEDQYSFDLETVVPADVEIGNHFTATHPSSFFRSADIVTIPAPWGRTTLFQHRLIVTRDGETVETQVAPGPEFMTALETYFGIVLDAPYEALKPLGPRTAR